MRPWFKLIEVWESKGKATGSGREKYLHHTNRASDNSREKKWNFAGFEETNSRRKQPISREFSGQIFAEKQTRKQKRKIPEKISEWCQIQGKQETQKFIQHSSEGNCNCFEQQEKHKNLYRNAWPPFSGAI